MPTVLFLHDKPRASAKVGPLLKKKGFQVAELVASPSALGDATADVVVVDAAADSVSLASAALASSPDLKGRVILLGVAADATPAGAISVPGGKLVDEIIRLAGTPLLKAPPAEKAAEAAASPSAPEGAEAAATSIQLKIAKIRELRARGIDPFPHRFAKRDAVCAIRVAASPLQDEQRSDHKLKTAGRIVQLRLMGKAAFFHLQDGSGKEQAYIRLDTVGEEAFKHFRDDIQIGDFVGVEGEVFNTKTGEPTLEVKTLTLLSKALRPLPEKWHGLRDPETRYRRRHLDLVSNPLARRLAEERCRIVESVRKTMSRLGYLEVETPILQAHAGGAMARPFLTHHNALDSRMYLRIALELYLKRLIIGGLDRVYEIGRIFRNEGIDTRHNPEFTMLEAYGAYFDYHGMAELFEAVFSDAAAAVGRESVEYRGHVLNLKPPFQRLYLPELWKEKCGADIHDVLEGKGFNRRGLLALAGSVGIEAGEGTPSAKVFERVFDERILPELTQPAFVLDHPTAITPLAKCKPGDESLVERFEFFVGTEELANAYTELNDPLDQRERFEEQARQRQSGNEESELLDDDFVEAMEAGMPPTGGIGMGIDRMVMILTGTPSIRELILFPTLKPE